MCCEGDGHVRRLEVGEAADQQQRGGVVDLGALAGAGVGGVDVVGGADGVPWVWLARARGAC